MKCRLGMVEQFDVKGQSSNSNLVRLSTGKIGFLMATRMLCGADYPAVETIWCSELGRTKRKWQHFTRVLRLYSIIISKLQVQK
jgi:hypothetical protein